MESKLSGRKWSQSSFHDFVSGEQKPRPSGLLESGNGVCVIMRLSSGTVLLQGILQGDSEIRGNCHLDVECLFNHVLFSYFRLWVPPALSHRDGLAAASLGR